MTDLSISTRSPVGSRPNGLHARDVALPAAFDLSLALGGDGLAVEPGAGKGALPLFAGGGKNLPVAPDAVGSTDCCAGLEDDGLQEADLDDAVGGDFAIPFMPAALGLLPIDAPLPDRLAVAMPAGITAESDAMVPGIAGGAFGDGAPLPVVAGEGTSFGAVAPMLDGADVGVSTTPRPTDAPLTPPLYPERSSSVGAAVQTAQTTQIPDTPPAQSSAPIGPTPTGPVATVPLAASAVAATAVGMDAMGPDAAPRSETDTATDPARPEALLQRTAQLQRTSVQATDTANQSPLDLRRDDWAGKMMERIAVMRAGIDAADTRIRLNPEFLGNIDVSVRRDGDRLHVHFTADNPVTRQMLAEAAPRLQELAEQRGIKLGQSSVDSGSGERDAPSQHPQSNSSRPGFTQGETDLAHDGRVA